MPASAIPLAPPDRPALSPVEDRERALLREGLRLRRSVDDLARAWYGSIVSLILSGVALKLFHDHLRLGLALAIVGTVALLGWIFAAVNLLSFLRTSRVEAEMLTRLRTLETRAPRPPELF